MDAIQQRVAELAAVVRARQPQLRADFARRLRDVAPEYYAIDSSDFQAAGWSSLDVVVDGALTTLEQWEAARALPTALADEAAAAARNHLSWDTLRRTYDLTHQVLWATLLSELGQASWARDQARVLQAASDLLFQYFDDVTSAARAVFMRTRSEAQRHGERRTAQMVGQVLQGVTVRDNELGYRLAQTHMAVIGWGVNPAGELRAIAAAVRADCLVMGHDGGRVWGWWGVTSDRRAALTDYLAVHETAATIVHGSALPGREGFATSHEQAKIVASLVARRLIAPHLRPVSYDDVSFAAVALGNETAARLFVAHQIAPLLGEDGRSAEMRDTIDVVARCGQNARRAARLLGVSERTVRNRLTALERRLGTDFRDRLPQLALAVRLESSLRLQRNISTVSLTGGPDA